MNYVNQECRTVAGHEQGRPDGFKGPLVRVRENSGRRVINFAESAPISMPVSEQVGRPFVELQIIDFLFYMYGEQKTADMLEAAAKAGEASRSKRYGMVCSLAVSAAVSAAVSVSVFWVSELGVSVIGFSAR